jgi:hypothetical protein
MTRHPLERCRPLALLAALALGLAALAQAATPEQLLASYRAQAGGALPSPERGQRLFTTNFGKELGWSCSSCHGAVPTGQGRDEMSEKPIAPLAPAANPKRFTDADRVESKFRLNCKDVVGRECTAAEKADLISWLMSLRP